jgi:hypothetical protein
MRKNITTWKSKEKDPFPLPKDLSFSVPQKFHQTMTDPSMPFYLIDTGADDPNRIIGFTTQEFLRILVNSTTIHGDGTFSVVPLAKERFYQVYTLHGEIGTQIQVPLAFFLLPDKTNETYQRMLKEVKSLCEESGLNLSPSMFMLDFEQAMINSVQNLFPECGVVLCFFHLSQSLWRKIASLHLKVEYQESKLIKKLVNMIKATAFVPADEVEDCFDSVKNLEGWPEHWFGILDYFQETYIRKWREERKSGRGRPCNQPVLVKGLPIYPIPLWNQFERTKAGLGRTNNKLEAFNGAFSSDLGKPHPSMWELLGAFQAEASNVTAQIRKVDIGEETRREYPIYKKINTALQKLCNDYEQFEDKLVYLEKVGIYLGNYV